MDFSAICSKWGSLVAPTKSLASKGNRYVCFVIFPFLFFLSFPLKVRDNIHSYDVARFAEEVINAPRCGEVYNIGGGRENACSILEAFALFEELSGMKMNSIYLPQHREGDHIVYISDLSKMKEHYPNWTITKSLRDIFSEVIDAWRVRLASPPMK